MPRRRWRTGSASSRQSIPGRLAASGGGSVIAALSGLSTMSGAPRQPRRELPSPRPSPHIRNPLPKMCCERIKVQVQTVAGEHRDAAGGQPMTQGMHCRMYRGLSAHTQIQNWDDFGERVNGQPQPERVCTAPEARANLVQLHVRQLELMEPVLVEGCAMLSCPCEPGGDCGRAMAEHPYRCCDI